MFLLHGSAVLHSVFILWIYISLSEEGRYCPHNFTRVYTKGLTHSYCLMITSPDVFSDLYKGCPNNEFSLELYHQLDVDKSNAVWSEYKNAYPGGPFINTRLTHHNGREIDMENKVHIQNQSLELAEDLCVVIDPVQNYMAVRCDKKYYRYCLVLMNIENENCEDLQDLQNSKSFSNLIATCVMFLSRTTDRSKATPYGTIPVNATWNQVKEICKKNGGSTLLNRGWVDINPYPWSPGLNKELKSFDMIKINDSLIMFGETDFPEEMSSTMWNRKYGDKKRSFRVLPGKKWHPLEDSFIINYVTCKGTFVILQLVVNDESKLILSTSENIYKENLSCFTGPTFNNIVKVNAFPGSSKDFELTPTTDRGYYACIYTDPTGKKMKSNKFFFNRWSVESLPNTYAIKLRNSKPYNDNNFNLYFTKWSKKLREYIYYTTNYVDYLGSLPEKNAVEKVQNFKRSTGYRSFSMAIRTAISNIQVKMKYPDAKTVLLHVDLNLDMRPVMPGKWDNVEVLQMRPVYSCKAFRTQGVHTVPTTLIGSVITVDCTTYKCDGDISEGVVWSKSAWAGCKRVTTEPASLSLATITTTGRNFHPTPRLRLNTTSPQTTTTIIPEVNNVVTPAVPKSNSTKAQLQNVMEDLEKLVNGTVYTKDTTMVLDEVNTILNEANNLEIPNRLLYLVDQLGFSVELNGSQTAAVVHSNIVLLVGESDPVRPIYGMKMPTRDGYHFTKDTFKFLLESANSTTLNPENNEVVVQLPSSVAQSARRISFVVFRNDHAFYSDSSAHHFTVNSHVVSVNVQNLTSFSQGEVIDIHFRPIKSDIKINESRACAYWHFNSDNIKTGFWSQDGCIFIPASSPDQLDICRCNHLTHFAEILVPLGAFSKQDEIALELLSVIGFCLSIIGLIMVGGTAALFSTWRRNFSNKIWLQLCISIFSTAVCFLVVVFAQFDRYSTACMLIGIFLHYSVLTSFCWMLTAAVLSYRSLVLVFTRDPSHKLLRACAFSYGAPCVVIVVLLSVAPQSYVGRFAEETSSGVFCYPSGLALWLSVYAPIAIMLLANWILFVLIVHSLFLSKRIQRHGDSKEALRCACVSCFLIFLFGLPWIFGLFASNIVAAYLFTITVTFQGFFLFLFLVLGNKRTRDLWLKKLKIKTPANSTS